MLENTLYLSVGSRGSPLAKAQVEEIKRELSTFVPSVEFDCLFMDSTGDKDQTTSLRTLGKTDFFTKEIDELLLSGACRIAIHSAKDLPEPLPAGLSMVALTHGVDPSDSLVLRDGDSLRTLPPHPVIATSSERREEAVRQILPNAVFIDLRGQIQKRLSKLYDGTADGVVLAEAALIRLGLTHLNRIKLPGATTPFQGQLAVLARSDDTEMKGLFSFIDSRQ